MTIVKINLHKVNAERSLDAKGGQIKINNNVSIKNVEDMAFSVEGKKGLKFTFTFNCKYEPELGKIDVEGHELKLLKGGALAVSRSNNYMVNENCKLICKSNNWQNHTSLFIYLFPSIN